MKSLQVELLDRLSGDEAHGGAEHRLSKGFGVTKVVLVTLAERRHELRWDQLHIVAQGQQLTAEVMGSDAGFHPNETDRHVSEARLNLPARELLAQDDGATYIQANQVEAVLADVDPKGGNVLKRSCRPGSNPRARAPLMKGAPVSTAGPSH
jgi:hypothetical protein